MANNKKIEMIFLGIFLIVYGVLIYNDPFLSGEDMTVIFWIFSIIMGIVIIFNLGSEDGHKDFGMILTGTWFVLDPFVPYLTFRLFVIRLIIMTIAISAGFIILGSLNWGKIHKNIGKLLLGIFMIFAGIATLVIIPEDVGISTLLVIVAGIFIIIEC